MEQIQCNIGKEVAYRPDMSSKFEFGKITSFNEKYVFVKFDGEQHSKACKVEQLIDAKDFVRK